MGIRYNGKRYPNLLSALQAVKSDRAPRRTAAPSADVITALAISPEAAAAIRREARANYAKRLANARGRGGSSEATPACREAGALPSQANARKAA
ncbi:MAG: hypothetical protein LBO72_11150 [Helicobacteraceae bacterium]|jgi:hypothetical protein|nr:hypothetical protein [Helicobacteraceae bacterium]